MNKEIVINLDDTT